MRPAFQRDRDRIIHCKAFRRLTHKTQVFFAPTGDHYRTRLTHTLEVSQIARTIAKVLRLHEELTEAITLGHDLGHTPFGHAGERVVDSLMPGGFNHYEQSLRIVDKLENDGAGLNLTWEVRDGIAKHSKGKSGAPVGMPEHLRSKTIEGQIMRVADLIAYVNHDIDDSTRAGLLHAGDLPKEPVRVLGTSASARIGTLVKDVVTETLAGDLSEIRMSATVLQAVIRSVTSAIAFIQLLDAPIIISLAAHGYAEIACDGPCNDHRPAPGLGGCRVLHVPRLARRAGRLCETGGNFSGVRRFAWSGHAVDAAAPDHRGG